MPEDRPAALVARGDAVEFYRAVGFSATQWRELPEVLRDECEACPDRVECEPQPMIHNLEGAD